MDLQKFKNDIFLIKNSLEFNALALKLFKYQYKKNIYYNSYVNLLRKPIESIDSIEKIPFIPIEMFKEKTILCENISTEKKFLSSGTTTNKKSKHYIESIKLYEKSIKLSFEAHFKPIDHYTIFCLTPEHTEKNESSLIHMCNYLIKESNCSDSGFYHEENKKLITKIQIAQQKKKPFIIIGLSFLILEFAQKNPINLHGGIIIETGGMKKKHIEIPKAELYQILKEKMMIKQIASEYSMTELLSQSYSIKDGRFTSPPWKKILIRDPNNPLRIINETSISGGINIIDLANTHSCAFIATNDLGKIGKNYFSVLGRMDNSSIRGCNNLL